MAQFCFQNGFVDGISCSRQDEKQTFTHFRICLSKALWVVHVSHLNQCGVVWCRTLRVKKWHSSGYPAVGLALQGQYWDGLAWCQYSVTGWKFDLQPLSLCGSMYNCVRYTIACCWETTNNTPAMYSFMYLSSHLVSQMHYSVKIW